MKITSLKQYRTLTALAVGVFAFSAIAILPAKAQEAAPAPAPAPAEPQKPTNTFTPPPIAGRQAVVSPDKAKSAVPDKSKLPQAAKSFTETLRDGAQAQQQKQAINKKPKVKARKHIVDVQLAVWGRNGQAAEALAYDKALKLAGRERFLVKDVAYMMDDKKRVICLMRINFTDEIPENWYMESEVVSGFGKNMERAYEDAVEKAAGKVGVITSSDWIAAKSSLQSSSDQGVIPFSHAFEWIGAEYVCKLYFRYFRPRQ